MKSRVSHDMTYFCFCNFKTFSGKVLIQCFYSIRNYFFADKTVMEVEILKKFDKIGAKIQFTSSGYHIETKIL